MVRGNFEESESMMKGNKKLFQIPMNWSMNTVTRPGTGIGRATFRKIRNSFAPLIRAASIISSGTDAWGVDPRQVDAEGADEYRQKHQPVVVCHPDLGYEQVLGDRQADLRGHDTGQNRAEDETATTETVLG